MSELLSGLALFLLFAWLGVVALLSTWHDREELRFQVRLFLWAIALRFAFSLTIYQLGLVVLDLLVWEKEQSTFIVRRRGPNEILMLIDPVADFRAGSKWLVVANEQLATVAG